MSLTSPALGGMVFTTNSTGEGPLGPDCACKSPWRPKLSRLFYIKEPAGLLFLFLPQAPLSPPAQSLWSNPLLKGPSCLLFQPESMCGGDQAPHGVAGLETGL